MYRRIMFISILPLMGTDPSVRAYMGCAISLASMVYYREAMPYRMPFTNVLGTLAQYEILACFLSALILEGKAVAQFGLSNFAIGLILMVANVMVLGSAIGVGLFRHLQEERERGRIRKQAISIDFAAHFSDEQFVTTISAIEQSQVPKSHVLVYHYTSMEAAQMFSKHGIPAFDRTVMKSDGDGSADDESSRGVIFSLRGPHDMKEGDSALAAMSPLSPSREAVIVGILPRSILYPLQEPEDGADEDGGKDDDDPEPENYKRMSALAQREWQEAQAAKRQAKLDRADAKAKRLEAEEHGVLTEFGVPMDVVTALMRIPTADEVMNDIRAWDMVDLFADQRAKRVALAAALKKAKKARQTLELSEEDVATMRDLSPPLTLASRNLLRAFQLKEDADLEAPGVAVAELFSPPSRVPRFQSAVDKEQEEKDIELGLKKKKSVRVLTKLGAGLGGYVYGGPVAIKTFAEYVSRMAEIRDVCDKKGLVPLYHYTTEYVAPFIDKGGVLMAAMGPGDGGVYFSTKGPLSYGLGTPEYEENLLRDCFGSFGDEDKVLEEMRGKHLVDVCFVYGVEPRAVRAVPGPTRFAKFVPKVIFNALAEPVPVTREVKHTHTHATLKKKTCRDMAASKLPRLQLISQLFVVFCVCVFFSCVTSATSGQTAFSRAFSCHRKRRRLALRTQPTRSRAKRRRMSWCCWPWRKTTPTRRGTKCSRASTRPPRRSSRARTRTPWRSKKPKRKSSRTKSGTPCLRTRLTSPAERSCALPGAAPRKTRRSTRPTWPRPRWSTNPRPAAARRARSRAWRRSSFR
jgi:hypothetical protein